MKYPSLLLLVTTCLVGCDASDGPTEASGQGCANVAEYSCFDNVVHRCAYNGGNPSWLAIQDCGASTTAGCRCAVIGSFGTCSTNGEVSGACQGEDF